MIAPGDSIVHVASVPLDGAQHCARCNKLLVRALRPQDAFEPGAPGRQVSLLGLGIVCTPYSGPAEGQWPCPDTRPG